MAVGNAMKLDDTAAGAAAAPCAPSQSPNGAPLQARLLDTLLEHAVDLVRQRSLLPAFDWRQAKPEQVERLIASLSAARMRVPAWLAKGLLTAGHQVPPADIGPSAGELLALAELNAAASGAVPAALKRQLAAIAESTRLGDDVMAAIVRRLLARDEPALACRIALLQAESAPSAERLVRPILEREIEALPTLRVRLAGTSTTHPLAEALRSALAATGWRAEVSEAGYGTLISELMQGSGAGAEADVLVVLLDRTLAMPADWRTATEDARRLAEDRLDTLIEALSTACRRAGRPVVTHTLPATNLPAAGHIDRHHATGEAALVSEVNRRLAVLAAGEPALVLVDADVAMADVAPGERVDARLWYYGRIAYAEPAMRALAGAIARAWRARMAGPAKVLALDFDNTLWGGVYGDDGIGRLHCGDDFPGNAYKALQQECLRLKSQGMLLVGLSKNNTDALDVFARHPGMALSRDDFAATAVNWEPKPKNIERLARELGLGLDSFVFIDDSPHERSAMREMCPAMMVPEMPSDPALRPQWLRTLPMTWPLRLTDEDSSRTELYQNEQRRRALRKQSATFEDYLAGLKQRLVIERVTDDTLARVAQLHQRTNQFNLTGLRLGEADLAVRMDDGEQNLVLLGRVSDRYGDHGIVLACAIGIAGSVARIDSFVMSCRVIGRQVEPAFLQAVIARLAGRNVKRVIGVYRPSPKNAVAATTYASMAFTRGPVEDDAELWLWDIGTAGDGGSSSAVSIHWGDQS